MPDQPPRRTGRFSALPRRAWLIGAGGAVAALGGAALWAGGLAPGAAGLGGPAFPPRGGQHRFQLRRAPGAAPPKPVNRRILGSNVQWVDNGDELLDTQAVLRPEMLALVQAMAPSSLRFPGGLQSDAYHWERATGPLAQRGQNEHAHNRVMHPSRMGTLEFLELCEAVGAQPLITVNLVTGTADEAARWVRAVNVTGLVSRRSGRRLPPVTHWELGNEPYLKPDERPDLVLQPDEFVRRAGRYAQAMRAVDPSIRLGLPVGPERRGGLPVTAFPGFTRRVYGALGDQVDWLAVHMAYMPFAWNGVPSAAALYWAAMASAASVQADLRAFAQELAAIRPGRPPLPMALTEYNALFTLGKGDTDNWVATPAGALYLADLLRSLATSELQMANQWSLSGNWRFGAIHSNGYPRPGYEVLKMLSEALHGEVWPLQVDAETVATAAVGLADAQPALPLVEALLCADGPRLNLLMVHKDPVREAQGRIDLAGLVAGGARFVDARLSVLSAPDLLSTADTPGLMPRSEQALTLPPAGEPLTLRLPPGSVALLRLARSA